jgi:hypothetical protein
MSSANHMQPIKLIVTDVDGTLLNSEHNLTERCTKALQSAAALGIQIVLATGKSPTSTAPIVEQLKLPVYSIVIQGMLTVDPHGKTLSQLTLHPDVARQVITFADDRGFTLMAYSGSRLLARNVNALVEAHTAPYHEPAPELCGPMQNLLWTTPIHKLVALGEPRAITGLRWQLTAQVGGSARVVQAGVPAMVEVLPPGGGKGPALKTLLKELRIGADQVMAIGDAENDLDMIQMVGLGIAVENAQPKVKEAAKVTVASNDADGVAEAIERFVLAQAQPSTPPAEQPSTDVTG